MFYLSMRFRCDLLLSVLLDVFPLESGEQCTSVGCRRSGEFLASFYLSICFYVCVSGSVALIACLCDFGPCLCIHLEIYSLYDLFVFGKMAFAVCLSVGRSIRFFRFSVRYDCFSCK
jgi:hypothetical protein